MVMKSISLRTARQRAKFVGQSHYQGKPCQRCGTSERFVANKTCIRCQRFSHRYHMADNEIEELISSEGCVICKRSVDSFELCVDHSHASGKVRGMLCRRCNNVLGMFNDDVNLFERAISYLIQDGGKIDRSARPVEWK